MANLLQENEIKQDIIVLKNYWGQRNKKFQDWYKVLVLLDTLSSKGLESYISNEPQTFYNMAHYLLTRGELSHSIPIQDESSIELDKRAMVDRGCKYMWSKIDRDRQLGGSMPFLDELGHYLLTLGWHSEVFYFDSTTGFITAQLWNPFDTYPRFADNKLVGCVHSYKVTRAEAALKAEKNGWNYKEAPGSLATVEVMLDDYWRLYKDTFYNCVLIDGKAVTPWVDRPEMKIMVAPVGGFPDKGSLTPRGMDWKRLAGRGIFEVNESVSQAFNKWQTMITQILRDTAQPVTQEFSQSPQATPEQLRERGALFHYAPGEAGLQRLPPAAIPIEIQAHLMEMKRESQKGSFNDAVYGMVAGESGYALSALASSSANQILYPFMDAKHFIISEVDKFWLFNLKSSKRVFNVKGKFLEKLKPTDIPDDVNIIVESDVATTKDLLERGTIATYLKDFLDEATIIKEVLKQNDPQRIIRRRTIDRMLNSPTAQLIEQIAGFRTHADYLDFNGDKKQAALFRKAADALEAQLGVPAPGQGGASQMTQANIAREVAGGAATPKTTAGVAPPEATAGFTPQALRNMVGRGKVIRG